MTGMDGYIVVQCYYCGEKELAPNEPIADHYWEFGCPACQTHFNKTTERLLQMVDGVDFSTVSQWQVGPRAAKQAGDVPDEHSLEAA